jgi:ketosteroid isomerase-like protein
MAGKHPNAVTIERLYEALNEADGETMASLYAADAQFRDPAFGDLDGDGVRAMWRMLCTQASDLDVTVSGVQADDESGRADWVATYTFSATGRRVENRVTASFRFRDGKISRHRDEFSLWRWSRQALGPAAFALGSNPVGAALIRRRARGRLEAWRKRGGGQAS